VETELALYRRGQSPEPVSSAEKDACRGEIEYFVACLAANRPPQVAALREAQDIARLALAV